MIQALEQFAPHHRELQKRLIFCFIVIGLTSAIAYLFVEHLVGFFLQPLYHAYPPLDKLVYTKLTEAFVVYIKLALLTGLFFSFPILLHQAWIFVAPGLLDSEKRLVRRIIAWSVLLFCGGGLFAFFIVLPRMLSFFMSYAGPELVPLPKIGIYLTFVARTVIGFAIAFEIPFLMFMAMKADLVSRDYFQRKRKYFYVVLIVLSFLLAAGEPAATVLITIPLAGLYEGGVLLGRSLKSPRSGEEGGE